MIIGMGAYKGSELFVAVPNGAKRLLLSKLAKVTCNKASVSVVKAKKQEELQQLSSQEAIGRSNADMRSRSMFAGHLPEHPVFAIFFVSSWQWPPLSLDKKPKDQSNE